MQEHEYNCLRPCPSNTLETQAERDGQYHRNDHLDQLTNERNRRRCLPNIQHTQRQRYEIPIFKNIERCDNHKVGSANFFSPPPRPWHGSSRRRTTLIVPDPAVTLVFGRWGDPNRPEQVGTGQIHDRTEDTGARSVRGEIPPRESLQNIDKSDQPFGNNMWLAAWPEHPACAERSAVSRMMMPQLAATDCEQQSSQKWEPACFAAARQALLDILQNITPSCLNVA